MRKGWFVGALCLVVLHAGVSCGARSSLSLGGAGGQVAASTTSTEMSGSGGSEVAGAGGDPGSSSCVAIDWIGDPIGVGVSAATPARRPRLIPLGDGRVGLVFEFTDGNNDILFSLAIDDAFGVRPPTIGAFDANVPLPGPFAVSVGGPGKVAFFGTDPNALNILGGFEPGQNGSTFIDLPYGGSAAFLSRSPGGSYLTGDDADQVLRVHWVSQLIPRPLVNDLGVLGCAAVPLVSDAASANDETFWVANSSDMPHDNCVDLDVPGAPLFINLWRAESSSVVPVASRASPAPIDELDLAAGAEQVWVGTRDTAFNVTLWRIGGNDDDVIPLDAAPLDARHALALMGQSLVVARLVPGAMNEGELSLHLVAAAGPVMSLSLEGVASSDDPVLLVDDDRALVAWADGFGSLWLARAQCVERRRRV